MTRWWMELVAAVTDVVPVPLLLLIMFVAAGIVSLLWATWPSWLPGRGPWRIGRPWRGWLRRRRSRRDRDGVPDPEPVEEDGTGPDELPDRTFGAFVELADRLAAEGRYAESVRERLRAIVRHLVDQRVIEHRPGWTVTELATAAAEARPAVCAPVTEAGTIFSDIWYGMHEAARWHDERMRALTGEIRHEVQRHVEPAAAGGAR